LYLDEARVEAAPAEAPIIVLPNLHRPLDYTYWDGTWAHGGSAGTDPLRAATVTTYNALYADFITEFGSNLLYVDIDSILNVNSAYFADPAHANEAGTARIAEAVRNAIQQSGLIDPARQSRTAPQPGSQF